ISDSAICSNASRLLLLVDKTMLPYEICQRKRDGRGDRKIRLVGLLPHKGRNFKISLRPEGNCAGGRRSDPGLRGVQIVVAAGRGLADRRVVSLCVLLVAFQAGGAGGAFYFMLH